MPELTPEQLAQLDTNIKNMLANGASQDDVVAYATDFKAKYSSEDSKKKESTEPSTGVGVGVEQSGSGSEVQSASTEKKIEPITQVGEEFQTVSEVESGKKEPQNEYLRNGATYTKEEYDTLNQSSQDITAKKQAYDETIKEFQKSGTIPSELIAFRKKEYEDAVAQQEKLVIQKTFPDDEKFANFYDLNTMQPMSVPAKDYQSFVTDFYDKNLKERFDGKSIDDLSWDEQRVLNYQFGINYLKKKDLQSYLDQTGGDVNLGDIPHAWNQFGQAAWSGISDMVNSLSISDNMATVDYLNAQFSKAYTGAISKDEYNTEIKSYGDKLRSQQAAGLPMTLPGVNPSGGYKDLQHGGTPIYTKEDVDKFIREIPPYEDAVLKSGTGAGLSNQLPYPQSNMFRDLANKLDKVIAVVPNNPKKKDSFVLNDIPQALGSSAGFALTGFLGIPELSFLTGAMQNASSTYKQAIELGASPDEAQKAFVQGLGVGTSEGAPIELIFRGLTNKFGSGIAGVIISGIAGGTAESIQEGLQGVANREILDFIDENRQKENIGRSMGAAAVTGLLMGMASKVAADPNASAEEKKVAASLMTDLQADLKEREVEVKEPVKEKIKPVEKVAEKVVETPVEEKKVEPEVVKEEIKVEEPVVEKPEEKPVEEKPELDKKIEEGKKKLAEIKAKNSQLEIKISDDEAENKYAVDKLDEQDNIEQEPSITLIESEAESDDEVKLNKVVEDAGKLIDEATGVQKKKVSEISTDEERFQGRGKLNERVVDNIAEKWSDADQDPIHVWTDPKDGKTYVLSGHHRLAGAQKAGRESVKIIDRTNDFTEAQAIKFAKEEANANRTMETPMERAKTLRQKRERGDSKEDIDAFLDNEGKNKGYVNNLSALNPKGRAASAVSSVDESGDKVTQKEVERIADWIGEIRRKNKKLTNAHEDELFDFLMDKGASQRITTKDDFTHKVNAITSDAFFNPDNPLNIKRFKNKTQGEEVYDQEVSDLEAKIADRQRQINEINERFTDPNSKNYISTESSDYDETKQIADKKIANLNAEIKATQTKLQETQQNKRKYTRAGSNQEDLFGAVNQKIEDKKAEIDNLKNDLNNIGVTGDQNKKRAELMAAYTDLAGLYIQKGIKSAVEFAKELGEELSDIIKEAWDNAVNVPDKEDGGRKKSLLNRAHEGTSKEDLRAAIEKHGLNYEPESWDEAKKKARDFIDEVGLEAAFDAVKKGDIVGAPAAFVWAEVIDKVHNEIAESTDPAEIDRLNDLEAELLSQFDIEARRKGQFISALQEVYAKADFNYNLEARIKDYKEVNNGVIPKEVEEKMIELDKQLKDVQGKLKEAEQRAKEAEDKLAFDAIKESVDRSKGEPLSREEIDRRVREGVESELNKAMSKLSKVRKATAKKAVAALEKLDQSLAGMYFESTLGIPVAIVRGGIKVAIAGIKLTGKVADAIESGLKHIQEEFEKQTGEKLKKSDYDRAKNLLTENLEGAGVDTSSRKDKTVREKDGKLKIPHELIRELVESGVDNITDLTNEVLKEVKKTIPDATERQVRDAITQYGRTVNLNQEEVETEIRRLKRIGRDVSKLEDIEQGKRPKRSGLQRDTLTAEERALQKQVKEGLKTLPMDVETQEKELRTSLDQIERRLENQIEDLQREIDTGEKAVKEKKVIEYNDRIKELIKERDNIKQIRDEMFADEGLTADERIDRAKKATERAINDIEKRISEGKLEPKTQTKIESPELTELREKLAEAKAKMKGLQDIAGITEGIRLDRAKQAVKKRIAELQQKIETSDFAKKVRKPLFEDSELAKLRAEKERIKEEFDKLRYQAELKNRSARQKFIDGLLEAWNLTRALRATFEFSPMLIQLGFYAVTHPIHAIRSLSYGFSHFFSKERADKFQRALEASPEYSHMKEDKLSITRPDYKQSVKEELYISQWLNTIWNFVFREGFPIKILHDFPARYERAATGMMNTMRVLRYMDGEEMLERAGITRESNPEDFKNVASMVNTFTLRTSLGKAEMASKLLSFFLFSPKAWASILKTWTPYAIYEFGRMSSKDAITGKRKVSVAQKMALADYAKFIGLTAGIVGMVATYLNNDDDDDTGVEFDPTSSDFLTMKIGNTRIDPWGGRRPMMVLQARLMLETMNRIGVYDGHSYKKISGETNRLGVPYKTPTEFGLLGQMTQNKLSPSMQIVFNAMNTYLNTQGERVDKYGQPYDLSDEVVNNLYPIYIETLTELWKDQPDATAGLLTFYAFLGGGVQTYLPKEGKGGVKKIQKVQTVKKVAKMKEVE